jgi:predicted ester cyclase
LAACEAIAAEEYTEHAVAPFGQSAPGKVNGLFHLRNTAAWLHAPFPDLHMTIESLVAEEATVACRIFSAGTNLGQFNGVLPSTGKRFAARQSHWFRIGSNQLVEHWATREDLPMLLQLGIIQPPSSRPS